MAPLEIPVFNIRGFSPAQLLDIGEKADASLQDLPAGGVIADQAAALRKFTAEAGLKVGKITVNPATKLKEDRDGERDDLKVGFYIAVDAAARNRFNPAVQEAALRIQAIHARRPASFQDMEYGVNSIELKQLLKDLGAWREKGEDGVELELTPEQLLAQADLQAAGLAEWATALAAAQEAFEEAEKEAKAFDESQPKDRPVTEIRGDYNEVIRLILGNLAWRAERGAEGYAERFNAIRKLIVDAWANVLNRETRAGSGEGAPG